MKLFLVLRDLVRTKISFHMSDRLPAADLIDELDSDFNDLGTKIRPPEFDSLPKYLDKINIMVFDKMRY